LASAGRLLQSGLPASLVIIHETGEGSLGTHAPSRELDLELLTHGGRERAFVQALAPPPHVLICGAGPDALPVVSLARSLAWRVTVVDHRPAYAVDRRFPGATVRLADAHLLRSMVDLDGCHAAVVMSHHLSSDTIYLRELAQAGAPAYVGLLGPTARRDRLVEELGAAAATLRFRIHGPVGFDLGAATPEGIALAIVSQIHAWLAGRCAVD